MVGGIDGGPLPTSTWTVVTCFCAKFKYDAHVIIGSAGGMGRKTAALVGGRKPQHLESVGTSYTPEINHPAMWRCPYPVEARLLRAGR